ncbi:uncharacterized protein LOC131947507 [Physella acuta]|uniref:uncharacterized protein LOC131947507 n=1 Tax=Physella acuta TaxID=109671 RepID=UPI0027DB1B3D|nr:uncharacterized protein LOC131947507 [Physella acuta]
MSQQNGNEGDFVNIKKSSEISFIATPEKDPNWFSIELSDKTNPSKPFLTIKVCYNQDGYKNTVILTSSSGSPTFIGDNFLFGKNQFTLKITFDNLSYFIKVDERPLGKIALNNVDVEKITHYKVMGNVTGIKTNVNEQPHISAK